jgi:hypothetical protein
MTWQPCAALHALTPDGREYWIYQPDSADARWWRLVMLARGSCRVSNLDSLSDAQDVAEVWGRDHAAG